MKRFRALVLMQLMDKLDFSFMSTKKRLINKIVWTVLRIVVVAALSYLFFYVTAALKIFASAGIVPQRVISLLFSIVLFLSFLSCLLGLMRTLFFANDNRVLITLPVSANSIFFSKLTVYYIFELMRSYTFTYPLLVGYGIASGLPAIIYLWMAFALAVLSVLPVAAGALLSIPSMYIYQYLRKHDVIKVVTFLTAIGLCVYVLYKLIILILENINLIDQWPYIRASMDNFIESLNATVIYPVYKLTIMMLGKYQYQKFYLGEESFSVFGCLVVSIVLFLAIVYILVKPLFLKMTAKPFEYEKKENTMSKSNKRIAKYKSILKKEFILTVRSTEVLYSFLAAYIAGPLLILLLNELFAAMSTKLLGQYMTYSFNLLILLLLMLASNALIATMYSMEGRAGYMKKTKPFNETLPLLSKIFCNMICAFISVAVSVGIFGAYVGIGVVEIIMLLLAVLGLVYGHMIWCAEIDIMNPQNEQYATVGSHIDNPNESKATLIAFIISFIVFAISLLLFTESVFTACLKLMIIGALFFATRLYLFAVKIKVYYREKN